MRCAIWYHSCNLKNVKNTHGGVLLLVTVFHGCFLTFFKLYKWYQIAQNITYSLITIGTRQQFRKGLFQLLLADFSGRSFQIFLVER